MIKKILVIDDDLDILEAVRLILQTSGYETDVSSKAYEIKQKIEEHHPDLIILDILLSGHDGRIICKNLKQDKVNIPILMMSAHPTAKDSVKLCGADGFVEKPFSVIKLLEEIEKLIG